MGSVGTLSLVFPVFIPASAVAAAYLGHRALYVDWRAWIKAFLTGPGRTRRILLVLFVLTNLKSMPFAWTVSAIPSSPPTRKCQSQKLTTSPQARIFHSFLYQFGRGRPPLPPRALFHYSITSSRTSLLETDYNLHKSNSTYFTDLDVSRSHLVTHLLSGGMPRVGANLKNKLVLDPATGKPVPGGFGIGLGAVSCSFRREIAPGAKYEMWSRILSWDRKWMYIVTHFVEGGKVRPTAWDGRRCGRVRPKTTAVGDGKEEDFSKYVIATALSKYVFKLGRFTVHPAIVLQASDLLPERPGEGWRGGESGVGTPEDLGEVSQDNNWDWRRVEFERRKGMEYAELFAALDGTNSLFDGGEDGSLGHFPIG